MSSDFLKKMMDEAADPPAETRMEMRIKALEAASKKQADLVERLRVQGNKTTEQCKLLTRRVVDLERMMEKLGGAK